MNQFPAITIVIPTYNRSHFLVRSLASLVSQDYPRDRLEVLVVDDGSKDQTPEILEKFRAENPCFRYLRQNNHGPAAARNAGIKEAHGDIILFMDDDCIAAERWAYELTRPYKDPNVGGVAGRVQFVAPDDNIANRCAARYAGIGQPVDTNGEIEFFVTANASFRRAALEEVGGFDTAFPYAAQEDFDLSYRIKQRGWNLVYTDKAVVDHYHHHTIRNELKRFYRVGQAEAMMWLKHGRKYSVWTELPLSLCAFWRVPFGCIRNLIQGMRPSESLMVPLLHRMNNLMLAIGRTKGYLAYRRQFNNSPVVMP
jgi:GT2 family glycosyltransferase